MASRPTIYIPNLDGRDRLAALMESLGAQTRPAEVVVVDNGSTDGSQELLRAEFPEVALLELGENARLRPGPEPRRRGDGGRPGGPAQQRRRSASRASSRRCSSRPRPAPRWSPASCSPSARPPPDRLRRGDRRPHPDGLRLPQRRAARGGRDGAAPLGPTGGAALFSRAAFDAVGGFDERIFLYYEDLDLALRLRAARRPLRAGARSRAPSTPTRRRWARRAAPSTRAPAGRAATCCAATA